MKIERRCLTDVPISVAHTVDVPVCCPASQNPRQGSTMTISYRPVSTVMPVEDLAAMADEYVGGRGEIRGMEEMIQDIARRVHAVVGVPVRIKARLIIGPPFGGAVQGMDIIARAGQ
jgi:hypothetical protein